MKSMGAFEAKTHLSKMLAEIEATGQKFIIKKRGKNVALLIPYDNENSKTEQEAKNFLDEIRKIRRSAGSKINKGDVNEMIRDGRR